MWRMPINIEQQQSPALSHLYWPYLLIYPATVAVYYALNSIFYAKWVFRALGRYLCYSRVSPTSFGSPANSNQESADIATVSSEGKTHQLKGGLNLTNCRSTTFYSNYLHLQFRDFDQSTKFLEKIYNNNQKLTKSTFTFSPLGLQSTTKILPKSTVHN